MEFVHKPVMLTECIEGLQIKPEGIYVDGTLGGAGHSLEIAKRLSNQGRLIGIDRDEEALQAAKEKLKDYTNITYVHGNHDEMKQIIEELSIAKVDGILLDLGVSSYQLDERARGFSYMGDAKLDMRMDRTQSLTAYEVVNTYTEEKFIQILQDYGEERFARQIVSHIGKARKEKPIETTAQLVDIIKNSIPIGKQKDGHPAKRTFQAIRIEVNNEIEPLFQTIEQSIEVLGNAGRLCVLTFHSLEDRNVKKAMTKAEGICTCPRDLPYCVCGAKALGKIINKKPIIANIEEQAENPRSKSAKLRIFEKIE